jgi:hypothetical protein
VGELLLLGEGLASPELDTLGVDGGEEGSLGGPLNEKLCPVGAVHNILWGVGLVVPEDANLVGAVEGELIAGFFVSHPRAQVLLLLVRFQGGGLVFFVDPTFATITLNIHQLVHGQGVLLIERNAVQLLDGGHSLLGGFVLHKGKSVYPQQILEYIHCPPYLVSNPIRTLRSASCR